MAQFSIGCHEIHLRPYWGRRSSLVDRIDVRVLERVGGECEQHPLQLHSIRFIVEVGTINVPPLLQRETMAPQKLLLKQLRLQNSHH